MAGLHSAETGPPEMLMELAYRLAVEDSPLVQSIRANVIVTMTAVKMGCVGLRISASTIGPGAPVGRGRVIVFATNPCYRWQNHGEFGMLFNAILHYNDVK